MTDVTKSREWPLAALLALLAVGAAALLAYPGLHPAVWRPFAEAAFLRPAGSLFPGVWRGLMSAVCHFGGVEFAMWAARGLGFAVLGGVAATFHLLCMDALTVFVCDYERHRRRRLAVKRMASALATIALVASEPVWRGAQSFAPDFLMFFMLLFALRLFVKFHLAEADGALYAGALLTGVLCAETPWAIFVLAVGFTLYGLVVRDLVLCSPTMAMRTCMGVVTWKVSFIVLAGFIAATCLNVALLSWHDGFTAGGFAPDRLVVDAARDYLRQWTDAAGTLGWISAFVMLVLPAVLLAFMMRGATDEEVYLPYRTGFCFFAGALVALSQLSVVSPLWIWSWGERPLVSSDLFQMLLSGVAAFILLMSLAVLGVYAFCRSHVWRPIVATRDIAENGNYEEDVESRSPAWTIRGRYRRAVFWTLVAVAGLLAALVGDRGAAAVREKMRILGKYADAVLADAEGCEYLFTDGRFDDAFRLLCAARGRTLWPFSFMAGMSPLELSLVKSHVPDGENALAARQGAPTLLRTWVRDRPELLARSGVQLGFEVWQYDQKPLPPCWGTLARVSDDEAKMAESIARARALGEGILACYATHGDRPSADRLVDDLLQTAQWRLARMARTRADRLDVMGRADAAKAEIAWSDGLDRKNGAIRNIQRALREVQLSTLRRVAPREALHLALVRADFASARFYAEQIVSAAPNNPEANFALAMSYVMQGHYAQAEERFIRCLELQPDDAAILNNLAMCRMALGRLDEARATAEKARTLAPGSAAVKRTLAEISEAEDARRTNGTPRAVAPPATPNAFPPLPYAKW